MADIDHAALAAQAVADELVKDVVATVKDHPQYRQAVEALSGVALDTLLRAIGVGV